MATLLDAEVVAMESSKTVRPKAFKAKAAPPKTSSRTRGPLGFLDLMPELRTMVYHYMNYNIRATGEETWGVDSGLLVPCLIILGGNRPVVIDARRNSLLALGMTCHQLYDECLTLAYATTMFEFEIRRRVYLDTDQSRVDPAIRQWEQLKQMMRVDLVKHIAVQAGHHPDETFEDELFPKLLEVLHWGKNLRSFQYDVSNVLFESFDDGALCGHNNFWAKIKCPSEIVVRATEPLEAYTEDLQKLEKKRYKSILKRSKKMKVDMTIDLTIEEDDVARSWKRGWKEPLEASDASE